MNPSESVRIQCPHCGESLEIAVDQSVGSQQVIEDCQVCCRPIHLAISIDEDGLPSIEVRRENE